MSESSLLRQLLDRQERELRAAGAVGRDDSQLLPLGRASGVLT